MTTEDRQNLGSHTSKGTWSKDGSSSDPPLHPIDSSFRERNFAILAAYHVIQRCGWIFKTESIIMPMVLDLLGGGARTRSFLPMLNRFGLSVPPLIMARRIKILPRKKYALAASSLVMTLCFVALAGVWGSGGTVDPRLMRWAFLGIYTLFFVGVGINQVTYNTLQGKLVATTRRGRLLAVTNLVGSILAIACVIVVLPHWLTEEVGRFDLIFGFTGVCFAIATMMTFLLAEPKDDFQEPPSPLRSLFSGISETLLRNRNFRRLVVIGTLFSASVMLFPHYQALGRGRRLGTPLHDVIWWVVIQNAGTGLFSILVGPMADRYGNRTVLRLTLPALCAAPLLALGLSMAGVAGRTFYSLVFVLVGLTPVLFRTMHNYSLELASSEDHPRYLSTINLCMAVPIFFSPLIGWLIDIVGFDPVFLGVAVIVLLAWLLTFGIDEPRHASLSCPLDSGTIAE